MIWGVGVSTLNSAPMRSRTASAKASSHSSNPARQVDSQFDVGGDACAVERRRGIGLDGARDVALHEEPLAVVERCQAAVTAAQICNLFADAEQGADEILEWPRQLDQQIRFVFGCQPFRRSACRHQARMDIDVGFAQPGDERGVETAQSLAIVEVIEAEPEGDRRGQRGRDHYRVSG